tara:strand:+ start:1924 stop:2712 length:789 start_codon:yes stop_codon:yes gene_type:complete
MNSCKIISWNVNGIRAIIKKDFINDINKLDADIICLQETKANVEQTKTALTVFDQYQVFANSSKARKGYSGTAVLTRIKPLKVTYDINIKIHDQEGRVILLEYDNFNLINVYVPNSGQELKRIEYRTLWDKDFLNYCISTNRNKPLVITGDFNVAHQEIDIARPKANYNKTSGYTQIEIDGFSKFLDNGFVDIFRMKNPEEIIYTWWNYRFRARERNVGWRIDYFLIDKNLVKIVNSIDIEDKILGSDHCPITLELNNNNFN